MSEKASSVAASICAPHCPSVFCTFLKLAGRHPVFLHKLAVETGYVCKPYLLADCKNRLVCCKQQMFRLFNPALHNIFLRRHSHGLAEHAAEIRVAHGTGGRKFCRVYRFSPRDSLANPHKRGDTANSFYFAAVKASAAHKRRAAVQRSACTDRNIQAHRNTAFLENRPIYSE